MERTYNDIVAENNALRKENAFIIGQLDFLRAMYGLPTYEEEKANKAQAPICKIISMNH